MDEDFVAGLGPAFTANRMRRLKKMTRVHDADSKNVHKMLPYGKGF